MEFVINDPAAFDSGPDAHYVVHTIAWARIPGRSVKLKTITKHWSDIGMEETVCAQSRKLVYTFNKAKLEKHERMNEVGRTKTLLIREAAIVTAVPVGGEGGGSTPHGLPRITTADGVVVAAAQPVTPGLFSKALAFPELDINHLPLAAQEKVPVEGPAGSADHGWQREPALEALQASWQAAARGLQLIAYRLCCVAPELDVVAGRGVCASLNFQRPVPAACVLFGGCQRPYVCSHRGFGQTRCCHDVYFIYQYGWIGNDKQFE